MKTSLFLLTGALLGVGSMIGCTGSVDVEGPGPGVEDERPEPEPKPEPIATGEPIWTRFHDTPGVDFGHDVAFDSQGRVVVVGTAQPKTAEQSNDVWVGVYTADGQEVWQDTYSGAPGQSERGVAVAIGPDDSIVVLGDVDSTVPGSVLRKYTPDGKGVISLAFEERIWDLALDAEGNALVLGPVAEENGGGTWLGKLDQKGGWVWKHATSQTAPYGSVGVDSEGQVFTLLAGDEGGTSRLRKYDEEGNLEGEVGIVCGSLLAVGPAGHVWIAGGGTYSTVCRYADDLTLEWWVDDDNATAQGIAVDPWGNAVVSGFTPGDAEEEATLLWIRKHDSEGTAKWTETYGGPTGDFAYGFRVATSPSGEIATTGIVLAEQYAIVVRKLSP